MSMENGYNMDQNEANGKVRKKCKNTQPSFESPRDFNKK